MVYFQLSRFHLFPRSYILTHKLWGIAALFQYGHQLSTIERMREPRHRSRRVSVVLKSALSCALRSFQTLASLHGSCHMEQQEDAPYSFGMADYNIYVHKLCMSMFIGYCILLAKLLWERHSWPIYTDFHDQ